MTSDADLHQIQSISYSALQHNAHLLHMVSYHILNLNYFVKVVKILMLSLYRNLLVCLIVLFVLGLDYRLRLMCFSWLEKKFIKLSICLRLFSIRRKFLTFRLFYVEKLFYVVRRSFFLGLYDHFIIICELFDKLFAEENLIN